MGALVDGYVRLWDNGADPPVAKDLTALFVEGQEFRTESANTLWASFVTTVAGPTNLDIAIEWTIDKVTWYRVSADSDVVTGGVVTFADGVFRIPWSTTGQHSRRFQVPPGTWCRLLARYNGGTAGKLLSSGILTDE